MTLALMLTRTAKIVRRTETSEGGGDYNEPTVTESTEQVPVYVSQANATESGAVALEQLQCFFLPDVALKARDLVEIDGVRYEVVGQPGVQWNPRVNLPVYLKAMLERTD